MAKKQPTYNIRCFFENGEPITEENSYLSKVNIEVTKFQNKTIIKKLNEMPRDVGEVVFSRLVGTTA